MFGQESLKFLLNSFYISIALVTLTACSIIGSESDAGLISPALPSKPSINIENSGTTSVPIEQFKPKVKATDVMIEVTIDPALAKKLVIKYGSNPDKLELEKLFVISELDTRSESDKTIVKVIIKDAGTIDPLYVSSAIESEDGVRSEYSAATLVRGAID